MNRRTFLTATAVGLLAPLQNRALAKRLAHIGLHLGGSAEAGVGYSEETLETVAALGYSDIEFRAPGGTRIDALATRRGLERYGLTAPSRHVAMPELFSNWRILLRECQILGNLHVVCTEVPELERATLDGYARVAELLNAAGKITGASGLQLGLHPHPDDFRLLGGAVPYDFLLASTDPQLVKVQLDLAVLAAAKRDPLDELARHRGRVLSVHINDVSPELATQPVGLGEGGIDLAGALAAADQSGVTHFFVDDRRPDMPWEHAKANAAYLSGLEF